MWYAIIKVSKGKWNFFQKTIDKQKTTYYYISERRKKQMVMYVMIYSINGVKKVAESYYYNDLLEFLGTLESNGYYVDYYKIKKVRK